MNIIKMKRGELAGVPVWCVYRGSTLIGWLHDKWMTVGTRQKRQWGFRQLPRPNTDDEFEDWEYWFDYRADALKRLVEEVDIRAKETTS